MSKTLEEILSGTDSQEVVTNPTETEDQTVVSTEVTEDSTEASTEATETSEAATSSDVVSEPEEELETVEEEEIDESEQEPATTEGSTDVPKFTVFRAELVRLNKRATLYANRECTRQIGSYQGVVRQVQPAIDGVALVEYTVLSTGGRLVKRAYIHI